MTDRGIAFDRAECKKSGINGKSMRPTEVKIDGEGLSNRPVREVLSELRTALEGASLWNSLDYFEISMAMRNRKDALFPDFEWLSCAPVTSGGHHYVYIGTIFNGRHRLIFVGKTSGGFERACEVANRCALELGA